MPFDLPAENTYRKIVTAPDGIEYLVVMHGNFWNAVDWICSEFDTYYLNFCDFVAIAWHATKTDEAAGKMHFPGDFHKEFVNNLEGAIWKEWTRITHKNNGVVNDFI